MKQCSCCKALFSTGKDYGDKWLSYCLDRKEDSTIIVEEKELFLPKMEQGLCEFCNPKHHSFCCPKHGIDYKIGNITYKANESNITV